MHMSITSLHEKSYTQLFHGKRLIEISQYVEIFLDRSLKKLFYPPVLQRLTAAQEQGDCVHILSSSPDFLVKAIASRLQVSGWGASIYRTDQYGQFSAVSQIMGGEEKALYAMNVAKKINLPPSSITVYSDSQLDLPLLTLAGKAVGVKPDSYLQKVCEREGWEIL